MIEEKEYLIICDESDGKGKYFSNFYGGVRVAASVLDEVNARLTAARNEVGLNGEVKWSKVDRRCVDMYEHLMVAFFKEIETRNVVARIMFTQNALVASGLEAHHYAEQYYILYYEFIKHAFGLRFMPDHREPPKLRIYLDELGDTEEQISKFKGFLGGLALDFHIRKTGLTIDSRHIAHVRSHDHVLLQCIDVVLGSITFRLNDKHKEKIPGKKRRGKRTVAKERLYKFIHKQICRVTGKHFNIGISTGPSQVPEGRWSDPYLHWKFQATNARVDSTKFKP